jgi:hypothetical protein
VCAGLGALHEAVLQELEVKHEQERSMLLTLIHDGETHPDTLDLIKNTQPQVSITQYFLCYLTCCPVIRAFDQETRGLGFNSPTGHEGKPWAGFSSYTASAHFVVNGTPCTESYQD